jgi:DNA-directed RNA polymerase specialized sigma24 family protein
MSTSSTYKSRALNIESTLEDAEGTIRQARAELVGMVPGEALAAIHTARLTLDDAEHLAVALLRSGGTSWQEIADALGTTRQAAHERFARDVV